MGEINTGMLKYKDIAAPEFKNRRVRINKASDANTIFVSRFNGNCELKKLNGPISFIAKDENFTSNMAKAQANETFHWLLKNSGNEKTKMNTRSYTSKKCNLDTEVFFMLVENEDYSDLYPISSWHVFEPDVSEKTLNKFNTAGVNAQWKREKSEQDKKLDEILERLKQKEESEKPITKRAQEIRWGERKKRESVSDGEDDEEEDDENIPVEKQDKKKLKTLVKLKRGDDKDEIDYVNSALSIAAVRKNMVDWDYSDDGKKSDDEDLNDAGFPPDELEDDEENENSDDDENNAESNLTCYGQAVQTLLKQQINDEEDDELDQYSDDDDDDDDDEDEEEEEEEEGKIKKEQGRGKKRKRKEMSSVEKRETAKKLKKQKEKLKKRKKHDEDSSDEDSDNDDEQDDSDDDSEEDSDEESDGESEGESEEESEEDSDDNEENEKEIEKEKEKEKKRKQPAKTDENTFNEVTREKFRKNKIQITKENCAKILYTIIEKNNGKMEISLLLNILNIKEKNQSFILLQKAIKTLCNISSQMKDNKKVKMVSIKPKYLKK